MERKRFTEEQIIGILKEHELGAKTADVCRKYGIAEATFYKWKSSYGGERKQNPVASEGNKAKGFCSEAWTYPRPSG